MKKFESIYIDNFESFINDRLIDRPSPIFKEMEVFAANNNIPILSPSAGSILKFLCETYKPRKILELGTGLGYSTAWMLSANYALEIDTLDRNAKELKSATYFLEQIKTKEQNVNLIQSHCVEFLKKAEKLNYDFIFIDCDKICYPEILEILKEKANLDTKLLFDNVLWHGRLDEAQYTKPSDRAIQNFWKIVEKKTYKKTLFAAGDGLLLLFD